MKIPVNTKVVMKSSQANQRRIKNILMFGQIFRSRFGQELFCITCITNAETMSVNKSTKIKMKKKYSSKMNHC